MYEKQPMTDVLDESIPYSVFTDHVTKIAISHLSKVKRVARQQDGSDARKIPQITWKQAPKDYKGVADKKYPTAFLCDYIESLELWFVVIDIDAPKEGNDDHAPIDDLIDALEYLYPQTYCTVTPSGGIHIYFLSKEKPKARQPRINIDYQANTGDKSGKYIIGNYRWEVNGTKSEYKHLPRSSQKIMVVENTDNVLKDAMGILVKKGLLKTEAERHLDDIIEILRPYYAEGKRQEFSLYVTGYLRKKGYTRDIVRKVIKEVFSEDEELETRLKNVDLTFDKPTNEVKGWDGFKDHISKYDLNRLDMTMSSQDGSVADKINKLLFRNRRPGPVLIYDYFSEKLELYLYPKTREHYERTEEGRFVCIDETRIMEVFNEDFGVGTVSDKKCMDAMRYITRFIGKNYDLIEFNNGMLNTDTMEFKTGFNENALPKMSLPYDWIGCEKELMDYPNQDEETKAVIDKNRGGRIRSVIHDTLISEKHPDDLDLWYRVVGHAFMGHSEIERLIIVIGPPASGKSTLTTILQHIFEYSQVPTSAIAKNERFTLIPLIGKDINIDDDIHTGKMQNVGILMTILSGGGIQIEKKGENKFIILEDEETPRLFANANTLPVVIGEGMMRRLMLINAPNVIPLEKQDQHLHHNIRKGHYNKNIEWLIWKTLTKYHKHRKEPIITPEKKKEIDRQYLLMSTPLDVIIEEMFEPSSSRFKNITKRKVQTVIKKRIMEYVGEDAVSVEHVKPSVRQMEYAMNRAGYEMVNTSVEEDGDYTKKERRYIGIKFRKDKQQSFSYDEED